MSRFPAVSAPRFPAVRAPDSSEQDWQIGTNPQETNSLLPEKQPGAPRIPDNRAIRFSDKLKTRFQDIGIRSVSIYYSRADVSYDSRAYDSNIHGRIPTPASKPRKNNSDWTKVSLANDLHQKG